MSSSATSNPESYKIHEEKVSNFYIARYEVTVGLYEKVTGKNPTSSRDKGRPVENISGYGCVDFCKAGKNPTYVGRGGCWIYYEGYCEPDYRFVMTENFCGDGLGLRPVRSAKLATSMRAAGFLRTTRRLWAEFSGSEIRHSHHS